MSGPSIGTGGGGGGLFGNARSDATAFVDTHPGGLRKLMSTDDAGIGAGPDAFSFSFSRGRNAHFPDTGRRFADGVQRYLRDGHATKIKFPPHGTLVILGRLDEG